MKVSLIVFFAVEFTHSVCKLCSSLVETIYGCIRCIFSGGCSGKLSIKFLLLCWRCLGVCNIRFLSFGFSNHFIKCSFSSVKKGSVYSFIILGIGNFVFELLFIFLRQTKVFKLLFGFVLLVLKVSFIVCFAVEFTHSVCKLCSSLVETIYGCIRCIFSGGCSGKLSIKFLLLCWRCLGVCNIRFLSFGFSNHFIKCSFSSVKKGSVYSFIILGIGNFVFELLFIFLRQTKVFKLLFGFVLLVLKVSFIVCFAVEFTHSFCKLCSSFVEALYGCISRIFSSLSSIKLCIKCLLLLFSCLGVCNFFLLSCSFSNHFFKCSFSSLKKGSVYSFFILGIVNFIFKWLFILLR